MGVDHTLREGNICGRNFCQNSSQTAFCVIWPKKLEKVSLKNIKISLLQVYGSFASFLNMSPSNWSYSMSSSMIDFHNPVYNPFITRRMSVVVENKLFISFEKVSY